MKNFKSMDLGVSAVSVAVATSDTAIAQNHVLTLPAGTTPAMVIAHSSAQNEPAMQGALTIEFWLKGTGVEGSHGRVVAKRGCSTSGYTSQFRPQGTIRAELGNLCDYPTAFPVATWNHYAVTWSRTENVVKTFVNGSLAGSVAAASAHLQQEMADLRFGEYCGQSTHGAMDNIRIWSVARSEAQIQSAMNLQFSQEQAARQTGLVGAWSFEGARPLVDACGLSAGGTLVGGASIDEDNFLPQPCPGDLDNSGSADAIDLAIVLANWGTPSPKYPESDANGDGEVNGADLAIVLSDWGACP